MWQTSNLTDLATVSTGKWDANHSIENGKFRFYTCASKHLYCDTKRFSGESLILPGNGANVGDVYFYEGDFDAYQRTYVIHDIKILPKFLHYHLLLNWRDVNANKQFGSATNFIKIGNFKDYKVSHPPLAEQQRIVAKLDGVFAEIDSAIEVANAKEAEVEKLKTSILSASFSGDAVSWKTVKLEEICHKITDGSHNPPKGVEYSEYLMLSSKNIHNDIISYDEPRFLSKSNFEGENKRTDIQLGDVLLTIVGTIGRCAVFEGSGSRFTLQRSVAVLKPKHDLALPRFMMYVLQSMLGVLNDGARGVAQKGIYLKSLKALSFPHPPLEEQQRIVAKLDAIFSELADAKDAIEQSKTNYLALKSAILAQELQSEVA